MDALRETDSGFEILPPEEDAAEEHDAQLINVQANQRFHLDVNDRDDQIADLFADTGRLSQEEIDAVSLHRVKVFITAPGGSPDAARAAMAAATALINAGGAGVFVDNCGNAHGPRDWLALAGDKKMGGMCWAFVSVTASKKEVFSMGMRCLGYRDAEFPNPPDRNYGGWVIHNFLGYSYQSGATILDGEAIGGPEGAEFRLRHLPYTRFAADTPFHNPYGVWRLGKIKDDENGDEESSE
jgi:hypothetical protein